MRDGTVNYKASPNTPITFMSAHKSKGLEADTSYFPQYLQKHGLRRMRFHDLRHSCASLLLANGVPLKQIQEWLGHSDFSTTANIYAHLDYKSKISSAQAMEKGIQLPGAGGFNSPWLDVTDSEEDDENDLNSNSSENQEF